MLLDKEVLLQRLHNLEQEMESKRRSQDDRSRHVKALEVGSSAQRLPPGLQCSALTAVGRAGPGIPRPLRGVGPRPAALVSMFVMFGLYPVLPCGSAHRRRLFLWVAPPQRGDGCTGVRTASSCRV